MYSANENPLDIIINPPGIQFGIPGETIQLHVVVTNQGDSDAIIHVFLNLDEELKNLIGWSNSPRESISLSPNQSSNEITFEFPIPVNASPATYDYTLVIDAPEHYPQHTPINCPSQLKILFKEQTKVGLKDPTFFIKPSTNPNKPLIFKPGEPLQLEVKINNNSDRVDRFRLTCPDLDEDWFTITYPKTGLESSGLMEVNALELNNKSQATILLQLHPPIDALEGNYNPAIRLYSDNYPNLVLLDLVYTQIPANYRLDIELATILGQVSYRPGEYLLSIINQGNVIRDLIFDAKTRDEEEICEYFFDPTEIQLLPTRKAEITLKVKPRGWWRRTWLGSGRMINFQVELEDKKSYPLLNKESQAILLWKSRPIWQFLLLLLLAVGVFGLTAFIIWRLLNPEPLEIKTFTAKSSIMQDREIRLNWEISQFNQLKDLKLIIKTPNKSNPENHFEGNFREKLSSCNTKRNILICQDYSMGQKGNIGKYSFELRAFYHQGGLPFSRRRNKEISKELEVTVKEKPIAEVLYFSENKKKYTKGDKILFSWKIKDPNLMEKVVISGKMEDGTAVNPKTFNNNYLLGQDRCKRVPNEQALECKNIPITVSQVGTITYKMTVFSDNSDRKNSKEAENAVEVLPQQFNIRQFTLNGSQEPNIEVEKGETINLAWSISGNSRDITVNIRGLGSNYPLVGKKSFPIYESDKYTLEVVDKFGKRDTQFREINIKVKPKPIPSPLEPISPEVNPTTPNNTSGNSSNPKKKKKENTRIPFPDI
ncbi:hypothetical protein [Calothrix rhizosoleniae]|uniref:COG1470 family protein n=1 Tax=Calothrix rhizosoleniae TaxID=888997 RepID=UPI000B49F5F5|nr:hypothetical protein [Calothrix rhizosoleniae]